MKSVREQLKKKYGIEADVGKKVTCPFCGHQTFSIKADDSIGKCFHPSCGKQITSSTGQTPHSAVNWVLRCLFDDCHNELLSQKGTSGNTAYNYIAKERNIHLCVVKASMIGAIPNHCSIDDYVAESLDALKNKKATKNKQSKNDKADLKKFFEELQELLGKCGGWLVFFYEDSSGRLVSIKLRKSFTKKICMKKPFKEAGVFIARSGIREMRNESRHLLISEGEFNALSLESLAVRHQRTTGQSILPSDCTAIAVGGVTTADWSTIVEIDRNPVICFDNDSSGAGLDLVSRGQHHASLSAFTTPDVDSDLDNFIRSFGKDVVAT